MTLEEAQEFYFARQAKKMDELVDKILFSIVQNPKAFANFVDKENYYSLAYLLFATEIIPKYREGEDLNAFIYSVLRNRFVSEIDKAHAKKREQDFYSVSIDSKISEESDTTYAEMIPSNFNTFNEACGKCETKYDVYMKRLSPKQRKIVEMLLDGYTKDEIREKLRMSEKDYNRHLGYMRDNKNVNILYRIND